MPFRSKKICGGGGKTLPGLDVFGCRNSVGSRLLHGDEESNGGERPRHMFEVSEQEIKKRIGGLKMNTCTWLLWLGF